jgi:tRNA-dihydrouridine synthase C
VNRHRGGAALLNEPELLHRIAAAVRAAVPRELPVTAKMRLGIDDTARPSIARWPSKPAA